MPVRLWTPICSRLSPSFTRTVVGRTVTPELSPFAPSGLYSRGPQRLHASTAALDGWCSACRVCGVVPPTRRRCAAVCGSALGARVYSRRRTQSVAESHCAALLPCQCLAGRATLTVGALLSSLHRAPRLLGEWAQAACDLTGRVGGRGGGARA